MTDEAPAPLTGASLLIAGFGLALINFVVVLDTTIANVSIPHIAGGLAVTPSQGTWVITSYAVAEAITVPLTGWLANRFGAVRWLIMSLIGFGLFSFLCGTAQTIEMLVVYRVFQGLSGGTMMPLTQTLLMRIFPKDKIPMALGLWGMTTITAPILGPILGGALSDNLSWHWIFFINIPVVILCAVIVIRMLPKFETTLLKTKIDVVGLLLLIIWVGALQMMLDTGREHDWFSSPMVVWLGLIALISFPAFLIWEWFEPNPVVNIRLLRDRTLAASTISISFGFGAFFALAVIVPLWLQQTLGYTATNAGYVTAYSGVLAVFMAPVAAILLSRVDPRITISIGIVWMAITTLMRLTWSTDSGFWSLVLPHLLQGLGMTFFFIGLTSFSLVNIRQKDIASAAGIMNFMRTMSGAIGTAVVTTLWDTSTRVSRSELTSSLNGADQAIANLQQSGMTTEQARAMVERLVDQQASTNGTLHVYMIAAAILLVAAALVWLAPKPAGPVSAATGH